MSEEEVNREEVIDEVHKVQDAEQEELEEGEEELEE